MKEIKEEHPQKTKHVQKPEVGELDMFYNWVKTRMRECYSKPNVG